jgi:hypothetical protein
MLPLSRGSTIIQMLSNDTDDIEQVLSGVSGDLSLSCRSQFFRSALFKAWHQRSMGKRFDDALAKFVRDKDDADFNALSSSKDSLDAERLNKYNFCTTFMRLPRETATVWLTEDGARLVELCPLEPAMFRIYRHTWMWSNVHNGNLASTTGCQPFEVVV